MIDLEKELIPKISDRCKRLRKSYGFSMERISDKASISRIEKGIVPTSGNFISITVLDDYVNSFTKSPKEIIFGSDTDIEELLLEIFFSLFEAVLYKDFTTHSHHFADGEIDDLEIDVQRAAISLAEMFAEYNLQRHHFLKSDDIYMDSVYKREDVSTMIQGKFINTERAFRNKPINQDTVIDYIDMGNKMWLMCKEQLIKSFQSNVIEKLFLDFKYSTLNSHLKQWISQEFNKSIVSNVLTKLKSNAIFKLGLRTKQLIDEFLEENIAESFQTTIPIKRTREEQFDIRFNNWGKFREPPLSEEEKAEEIFLIKKIYELAEKQQEADPELVSKLKKYNFVYKKIPKISFIEEVSIDSILVRAMMNEKNGITLANPPMFEDGTPIFRSADFNSREEIYQAFENWHDDTHFNNQIIPGYFTNNSQIVQRLQEYMNDEILASVNNYIHTQNNLLKLLSDEELITFAK